MAAIEVAVVSSPCIVVAGQRRELAGERELALLVRLATATGDEVRRDLLLHDVWNGTPPNSGTGALRVQVRRLRQQLGDFAHALQTTAGGYAFDRDIVATDLDRLRSAVGQAEAMADPQRTIELLNRLPSPAEPLLTAIADHEFVRAIVDDIRSLHRRRVLLLAEAHRALGTPERSFDALAALTIQRPLDEGVAAHHLQTLADLGERRAALEFAHAMRVRLREHGLSPGPELAEIEQRILNPAEPPTVTDIPLVGRDREWSTLVRMLDDTAAGTGAHAAIVGAAGLGKSHLVDLLVDLAETQSWTVIRAGASRTARVEPFHLVTAARRTPDALPELDQAWRELVPNPEDQGRFHPTAIRHSVAALIRRWIEGVDGPVLVVAEDLHWADPASLAVVEELADTVPGQTLLITTGRSEHAWPGRTGVGRRVDLTLDRLDPAAGQKIAEQLLGHSMGSNLARRVDELGGHPLLIVEYLRGLRFEGRIDHSGEMHNEATDAAPATIVSLVRQRMAALPRSARRVVEAVAVAGVESTADDIVAITELAPADWDEAIRAVRAHAILETTSTTIRFTHDLMREAALQALDPLDRARLHRKLAGRCPTTGPLVVRRAAHLLLSTTDDAEIVEPLRRAAAETVAVDPLVALEFLDRALQVAPPNPSVRFAIQHARVEALTAAGSFEQAREVLSMLMGTDSEAAEGLHLRLAGLLMAQSDPTQALELLTNRPPPNAKHLAARHAALLALCAYASIDLDNARRHAHDAIELGRSANDSVALSIAHGVDGRLSTVAHAYTDAWHAALLACEYAEADATGESHMYLPHLLAGLTALDLDDHAAVESQVKLGRAAAARHHLAWTEPLYAGLEASLAWRRGRVDEARAHAARVLETERAIGRSLASAWASSILGLVALRSDNIDIATTHADAAEAALAAGSALGVDFVPLLRAELQLALGERTAAFTTLSEAFSLLRAIGLGSCLPLLMPRLADLAVLCEDPIAADVAAEAERLREASPPAGLDAIIDVTRGVLHGSRGDVLDGAQRLRAMGRMVDAELAEALQPS